MTLYYLLFYSIYFALRKTNYGLVTISTILVFAGLTLFLATHAIAATEIERNQLLAAGEAIIASDMWHGTGAQIGGLLLQTGALLISFVMLKDNGERKKFCVNGQYYQTKEMTVYAERKRHTGKGTCQRL